MSDLIDRQAAIDTILHNQEVYSNNFGNDPIDRYTIAIIDADAQAIAQLPAAQPDKSVIEDCLYHIHRNTSVHTSAEGVVAIKYYMGELWRELFGEEDMPEWMS